MSVGFVLLNTETHGETCTSVGIMGQTCSNKLEVSLMTAAKIATRMAVYGGITETMLALTRMIICNFMQYSNAIQI